MELFTTAANAVLQDVTSQPSTLMARHDYDEDDYTEAHGYGVNEYSNLLRQVHTKGRSGTDTRCDRRSQTARTERDIHRPGTPEPSPHATSEHGSRSFGSAGQAVEHLPGEHGRFAYGRCHAQLSGNTHSQSSSCGQQDHIRHTQFQPIQASDFYIYDTKNEGGNQVARTFDSGSTSKCPQTQSQQHPCTED